MNRSKILKALGILGASLASFGLAGCQSRSLRVRVESSEKLEKIVSSALKRTGQPSAACALIQGSTRLVASSGTTKSDGTVKVSGRSLYHIGSTTKSMTALLVEMLVESGLLSYDSRIGDLLAETKMLPEYREATVLDLLLSRAGLIPFQMTQREDPSVVAELWSAIPSRYPEDPRAQRAEMTKYSLSLPPISPPGPSSASVYSNLGWAVLGHIVELKTGMSYEDALEKMVFKPLGIAGFKLGGWPRDDYSEAEPLGHYPRAGLFAARKAQSAADSYVLPAWMNPSGGVSMDIEGFAAYAEEHLRGLKGEGKLLPRSGYERLHGIAARVDSGLMYQQKASGKKTPLGHGWGVEETKAGNLSFADGSAGTYYARLAVYPAYDLAFAGLTNAGDGNKALSLIIKTATGFDFD